MPQLVRLGAGVLIGVLALPASARPDPPPFLTDADFADGTVAVSLADGTLSGHGTILRAPGLGRGSYSLDLTLAPRVSEPLCRDASGTMRWTMRSGDDLLFSLFAVVCHDPNSGVVSNSGPAFTMKLVDGSGRFEGWTGNGVWELVASLDDSGTTGIIHPNFATVTLNRR